MNAGGPFYAENKMGIRYFYRLQILRLQGASLFRGAGGYPHRGLRRGSALLTGKRRPAPAERAAAAILAACRWLSEIRALVFIENDAESLLRRLPRDILSTHYHDDEGHIRALPEESGLCPRGGTALAAAGRGLILTVSHQEQMGQLYPQILSLLVHGACRELF